MMSVTNNQNLTHRVISGGGWQFTAVISSAVMQLIVLSILARLITPAEFGILAIANMVVGFAVMFMEIGLGPALIQHQELRPQHLTTAFTVAISMGFVGVAILWVLAPAVSALFHVSEVREVIRVVSLSIIIGSIGIVPEAFLQKDLRFKTLMQATLGGYFFGYVIISILFAFLGFGIWSLVAGILGNSLVKVFLLLFLCRWRIQLGFDKTAFRTLMIYGGGQTMMRFFNYSASQADYFVTGNILGTVALGLYERAFNLMLLPGRYVGDVLDNVLFPAMSQIQNDRERISQVYLRGIEVINLILVPLSVFLIIWARELVVFLLGLQWFNAIVPFQILAIGISLRATGRMSDALVRACGKVYICSLIKAVYFTLVVLGSWAGSFWGVSGVAIGVSIAMMTHFIMMSFLGLKIIKTHWLNYINKLWPGVLLGFVFFIPNLGLHFVLTHLWNNMFIVLMTAAIFNALYLWFLWHYQTHLFGKEIGWILPRVIDLLPDILKVKLSYLLVTFENK